MTMLMKEKFHRFHALCAMGADTESAAEVAFVTEDVWADSYSRLTPVEKAILDHYLNHFAGTRH